MASSIKKNSSSKFADYLTLTKPNISTMVMVTTLAGFYLGVRETLDYVLLLHTIIGTALIVAGTNALNQVVEIKTDALMHRTKKRPLPDGRIAPLPAQWFSTFVSIAGIAWLSLLVNSLTGLLAALTLALYVFVYTPAKKKSTLSTLIGAVPGALPPVGGWAAARGEAGIDAWVLFGILFFWQLPHFLAIARLYKDDYKRGGMVVLPLLDQSGRSTGMHIISNTAALIVISLMPTLLGTAGKYYFVGALLLGGYYLHAGIHAAKLKDNQSARKLLLSSVVYLPALLFLMVVDKNWL